MRRARHVDAHGHLRRLSREPDRELARLLGAGLVTPRDCLDDAFEVVPGPGRNAVVVVRTRARTLAVKRFPTADGARRERQQLVALQQRDLRHFAVPEPVLAEGRTLVTATGPGLVPLIERLRPRGSWRSIAWAVGSALGELHAGPLPPPRIHGHPTIFDPLAAGVEVLAESPAVRDAVRGLQADAKLAPAVARLAERLDADPPVGAHGDVRAANLLVPARGRRRLTLIDWETGGPASPSVDVGAALAMVLEWSVLAAIGRPATEALTGLVVAYARAARRATDVRTVVQCAGLRLLRTAVEYCQEHVEVPVVAQRFRSIGSILLTQPEEGAIRLGLVR